MKLFLNNVSTIVDLLRDREENDTLHSIPIFWKEKCDLNKYPFLTIVVYNLLNQLPILRRIVQRIVDHRDDIALVENAVENLLTEMDLVYVKLSERFEYDPQTWCDSRATFDSVIESKLRVRYYSTFLLDGASQNGSFEYSVGFNSLLISCDSLCDENLSFKGFELPSSFGKLESSDDESLLHTLEKLQKCVLSRFRKEQVSVLKNLGIGTPTAKQIIRKQLMNNYSIIHQLKNWIDQLGDIKDAQHFAKVADLDKEILLQLNRFDQRFPNQFSVKSWFFNYCESRLWFTYDAFPENIEPGVVFQTTPCGVSDVPSVPGILDLEYYVNENRLFSQLGIEPNKNALFWFHGTSWEFAKNILSDGIRISRGNNDYGFGKCFHITNNFTYACDWAKAKYSKPAVIIYQIPYALYDQLNSVDAKDYNDRQKIDFVYQLERIGGYETKNLGLKSGKHFDRHASGVVLLRCLWVGK